MSAPLAYRADMVAVVPGGLKLWTDRGIVMVEMTAVMASGLAERFRPVRTGTPRKLRYSTRPGGSHGEKRAVVTEAIRLWGNSPPMRVFQACRMHAITPERWNYYTRTGGPLHEEYVRAKSARIAAKEAQ